MATAKTRFIDANGVEYKKGDTVKTDDLSKEYLDALEKADMIDNGKKSTANKPAVAPKSAEQTQVVGSVSGSGENTPPPVSQHEEVGTVGNTLPDPVANRETVETTTGEYHTPVGSVSGDAPINPEPEATVVGTVSDSAKPVETEAAAKPVNKFASKAKKEAAAQAAKATK